jgi:hypothetical protein
MFAKRLTAMLGIVMLICLPLGSALAQSDPTAFCGDLAEADCAILIESQTAMQDVSSFGFDMNFDMAFSASEELADGMDSLALSLAGTGDVAMDTSAFEQFQTTDPAEMMDQMSALMENAPEMLVEVLRSAQADVSFQLTLPAELAAESGMPNPLPLNLLASEGVVYLDLGSIMPASEEDAAAGMPAWMGIDLAALYENTMSEMPDAEEMDMGEMEALMENDAFTALMNPDLYANAVVITRLDDAEVDGTPVAVFETIVDYNALAENPEFQQAMADYMNAVIEMQGVSEDEMPADLGGMMATIFEGISVSTTQYIGLEDYYTYRTMMAMDMSFDAASLAEFAPEGEDTSDMTGSFSMSFSGDVSMSNFNEAVEVTVPEDAQVIDPMMFMGAQMEGMEVEG